jgi:glutamate synthase domain-containing protein 3
VDEGVEELNFTQFANYPEKRRKHLMHEIEEVVEEGEMPLESYIGQHPEAKLSDDQKHLLEEWAKQH